MAVSLFAANTNRYRNDIIITQQSLNENWLNLKKGSKSTEDADFQDGHFFPRLVTSW